ncbi:putative sulfate exporter family transporter, partial [Staphylococcus epidermidis]|uniref:putative sulfate exporter family transporter n=1 Tax=Staphylococcus epidermidis TaxID=1282 RepID=UPI0011A94AAA
SKEKDIGISVGIIGVVGSIFGVIYTAMEGIFKIGTISYGGWRGMSVDEMGEVVLGGGIGGWEGMRFGLVGKLGRVFLLIGLS